MQCHGCIRCRTKGPNFKNRSFKWREIIAWSMLDFSNSIVIMALANQFTVFVTNTVYEAGRNGVAMNNIMYANIVLSVLTFFISPPIGVLIDRYYIRLPIVIISIIGYSVATMAMYGVKRGHEGFPISMYAIAIFFFRLNEMVAGAFLPGLCNDRDMGFVSTFGYFIGFVSGVIVFLLLMLFTTYPSTGSGTLEDRAAFMLERFPMALMVVGIIMLLSGVPPMLMLDNGLPKGEKRPKFTARTISDSFKENARTIKEGFTVNRTLTSILLCYILISVAIQGVGTWGSNYLSTWGAKYGVDQTLLMKCGLYYNAAVGVFSLIFGLLSKVTSSYILVIIQFALILVGACTAFWFKALKQTDSFNPGVFWAWFTFVMYGFSVGPIQAVIRGTIGLLTPDEKKGEIFGCLESMIILGSIIGTTIPGLFVRRNYWAFSVWIVVFLAAALVIWIFVPVMREEKKALRRIQEREEEEERKAAGGIALEGGVGVSLGSSSDEEEEEAEGTSENSSSSSSSSSGGSDSASESSESVESTSSSA